jgi:hypothetical protein
MVAPTDDDSELPLVTRQPLSAEDVRALTQLEHFIERRGFAKSRRRVGIVGEAFAVIALSVTAVALIITLSPHNNRAPTNGGAVQTEAPSQHPPSTPTVLARPAPAPRIRSAMAFDPANQRFVLFGGSAFGGDTGDTWVWSGGAWSQLHPANSPSARDGATLAYDPVTRGLILFGGAGADAPSGQFSDTWELTGMDWKQLSPRSSPPPRAEASMATDSTHNSVILFGGLAGGGMQFTYLNDTWAWDGHSWRRVSTSGPSPRSDAGLAYDPMSKAVVLYGGVSDSASFQDTWSWEGANWSRRNITGPPAKLGALASGLHGVLLFGGVDVAQGTLSHQTWMLDASGWHLHSPSSSPSARWGAVLAFDEQLGVLLFGGSGSAPPKSSPFQSDTWLFDGLTWHAER